MFVLILNFTQTLEQLWSENLLIFVSSRCCSVGVIWCSWCMWRHKTSTRWRKKILSNIDSNAQLDQIIHEDELYRYMIWSRSVSGLKSKLLKLSFLKWKWWWKVKSAIDFSFQIPLAPTEFQNKKSWPTFHHLF